MKLSAKRAEYAAITGLVLSIIFFGLTLLIGSKYTGQPTGKAFIDTILAMMCGAYAVTGLGYVFIATAFIWFVLVIQFHQRCLAEQEKLDMVQLAKAEASGTIFKADADRTALLAVAQKRLVQLEKWFVPIMGIFIAVLEITAGIILFRMVPDVVDEKLNNPILAAVFMVLIAFVCLLISRYTTGMSTEHQWKPLRAGGSYFLAISILAGLIAISLALAQYKYFYMIRIFAWIVPVLLVVLGIEILINTVMDIYRPRVTGQYSRAAFDSRLLGLINEPGGFLHTIASAIDYQFGFKVSQTWFYKLLEKAIVPLIIFSAFTLYLLSCIVIIDTGQEAIFERLGSYVKTAQPGIHFKFPWPFDKAEKYPVKKIHQINVGFVENREKTKNKPLLWSEDHYEKEYNLLVATVPEIEAEDEGVVPVSIIRAAVPVQYRIKNLKDYVYNHSDTEKVLESISYRELVLFAASAKIEPNEEGNENANKLSLLGAGRQRAAQYLASKIQMKADQAELGVEIVFLGLQGVHPPKDVAKEYEQVNGAIQRKQASILNAEAERNKMLSSLCGSVSQAGKLYEMVSNYQQGRDLGDVAETKRSLEQLNEAFNESSGDIFKTLSQAQSYAFEKSAIAEATGKRFSNQYLAYKAFPEFYKLEQLYSMYENTLSSVRKYIVVADKKDSQIYIIDLQENLQADLLKMDLDSVVK